MTVRFLEGFELQATEFAAKYREHYASPVLVGSGGVGLSTYNSVPGRLLGQASNLAFFTGFKKATTSLQANWTYFVAVRMDPTASDGKMLFSLCQGTQVVHTLKIQKIGTSVFCAWFAGPANDTFSGQIGVAQALGSTGTWLTIETRVTLGASGAPTGALLARLNGSGTEALNVTSVVTSSGGTGTGADTIMFHTNSVGSFDDLWADDSLVWNGDATAVAGLAVDAVSSADSTTVVAPSADVAMNDNRNATYNQLTTIADKDLFTLSDVAAVTSTVLAVELAATLSLAQVGTRQVDTLFKLGGTTENSAAHTVFSTQPTGFVDLRTTKPGGGAFAVADLNNLEVGYEVAN